MTPKKQPPQRVLAGASSAASAQGPTTDQRREQREKVSQPVVVSGLSAPGQRFDTAATTHDISRYGMSLLLPAPLPLDTAVLIENPATGVRMLYRVVRVEQVGAEAYWVGFEAPDPSPRFWEKPSKQ